MKVLVTGAAGLIGSEVCKSLLEKGHDVLALDNFSIGDWKAEHPKLKWRTADLADLNPEDFFSSEEIDVLVHCAAHPGGKSLKEPVLDVEINALGSMKLFNWCAQKKIEVIYLSSSAVYGPLHPDIPLEESSPLNPGTIYAACKVACENFLKILGEGYGLQWTVLRLFATYGGGHKLNTYQGIVNVLLTQILQSDRVIVKGSLDRVRGLIYVKDAASAIVHAVENKSARGHIINISHPLPAKVGDILQILMKLTRRELPVQVETGTVGDPMFNYANTNRSKKILGFEPKFTLEEGLKELVAMKTQG